MTVTKDVELVKRFQNVDTATICDVCDELGLPEPAIDVGIRRLTKAEQTIAGFAYPIQGRRVDQEGPDKLKLQVVDGLPTNCITVWSGTDAGAFCLFGDLIAGTMKQRGCLGAVVDGGIRDLSVLDEIGFPCYARFTSPVQSIGRWRVTSHNEPVVIRGANGAPLTVRPGDMVVADSDGVVIIRKEQALEILERAEEIVHAEKEARSLSKQGLSATEMLEKFGHV